jgi:hypothetical protein
MEPDDRRGWAGRDDKAVVELIQAEAVGIAGAHARIAGLVAELFGRTSMAAQESPSGAETLARRKLVEYELRAALRLTWRQAGDQVRAAVALDERMFATMIMLRAGAIDWGRVQVIAKHATGLGDHVHDRVVAGGASSRVAEEAARAVVRRLEEAVLAEAPVLSPGRDGRLEQRLAEAVAEIDPEYAESLRVQAVKRRSVSPPRASSDDPEERELKDVWAQLPAPEAQAVWRTIDGYARHLRALERGQSCERTLGELRADVLTHLILRGHPPVATPDGAVIDWTKVAGFDRYGLRANIDVTVSLETLLGIRDQPGHLTGHGPITAQVARDIAFKAGGSWRRVVTDAAGQVVDYGRTRYEPPAPLKEFVQARDRSCRTPWCDRPAGTCDADHVVPYPAGPTAAHNLQCKCRHCHRMKHEGRWRHEYVEHDQRSGQAGLELKPNSHPGRPLGERLAWPAGTIRMISPTGMEYYSTPAQVRRRPRLRRHPLVQAAAEATANAPDSGPPPF